MDQFIFSEDYIKTVKIDVAEVLGGEGNAILELKEMDIKTSAKMARIQENQEELVKFFIEKFPSLVVSHNIVDKSGAKVPADKIINKLAESTNGFMSMIEEYQKGFLSEKRNLKK